MKKKKKKQRCPLNHEIPTCFTQKCNLKCGFRHPKPFKLFQVAGQCSWKACSYAHNPQPAGMHPSQWPYSAPPQHPVLFLGQVENDKKESPLAEQLKEALDTIQVLQQQVQNLTSSQTRLEGHILNLPKDDSSSNLVSSSIESMKEANDAKHRHLEMQISESSKDRNKLLLLILQIYEAPSRKRISSIPG
jgi:ribosomal protein S15P/S13E